MRLKKGNIVILDFNPTEGHEQAGRRPAVVVSGNAFNEISNTVFICPITNRDNRYPLHVPLDERTGTTGFVMADQIRTISPDERNLRYVEEIPHDILERVANLIKGVLDSE